MALTPEDILNTRFRETSFRAGYNQDDVDNFIDKVAIAFRELRDENEKLKRSVEGNSSTE